MHTHSDIHSEHAPESTFLTHMSPMSAENGSNAEAAYQLVEAISVAATSAAKVGGVNVPRPTTAEKESKAAAIAANPKAYVNLGVAVSVLEVRVQVWEGDELGDPWVTHPDLVDL